MHWVARQNKLELPNDEEEVNTRDIHKCDGQAHDPDTMADTKSRTFFFCEKEKKLLFVEDTRFTGSSDTGFTAPADGEPSGWAGIHLHRLVVGVMASLREMKQN
jgi:hypothetical protein